MSNKNRLSLNKIWRTLLTGLLVLMLVGTVAFFLWASNPAQPESQALSSLQTDAEVLFEDIDGWLVFTPAQGKPKAGLIFYPGGRVDYRAYAPHARAIANEGFTVIIVPMPLNFAFLGINRADEVITVFPEIETWAVGGHSLGGAMAAEYVSANPSRVDGLVLWASYPGGNNDLSLLGLPVLSVFADNDGLATVEDITSSQERLPVFTSFIEITGGNHAGFGWYGPQNGDGTAFLDKFEQQALIVQATTAFLDSLGN